MHCSPQSVVVVPTPRMPLAPKSWTVRTAVPPPDEQLAGTVAETPVSAIAWNGMAATVSPATAKSALRTEPKA